MSTQSKIEWTEYTWNLISGCRKVSAGCVNCYAEKHTKRLQHNPRITKYRMGFNKVVCHPGSLEEPFRWRKPGLVFVCSMSDLFGEAVSFEFVEMAFDVMRTANQHIYQVLTKRAERMAEFALQTEWPTNVWAGVTVENDQYVSRIDALRRVPAQVRFLSVEPMLGPLSDLDLSGIHWVIVGGESGPRSRPMEESWVCDVRDQCVNAGVAFFFKQWGGRNKKKAGRELQGCTWDEMPDITM